ncbi:MAG: DUF493 domain-containing protein [Campylobacteraceae bacterium]
MANIDDIKSSEVVLKYPCKWEYKVIALASVDIDEVLNPILKDRGFTCKASKSSTQGAYKSYSVSLLVHNDDDRKFIYESIRAHKNIKMVL